MSSVNCVPSTSGIWTSWASRRSWSTATTTSTSSSRFVPCCWISWLGRSLALPAEPNRICVGWSSRGGASGKCRGCGSRDASSVPSEGRSAKHQAGFLGANELLGITDPPFVGLPDFFPKWLRASLANSVELMVHPGYHDTMIDGRDGSAADGQLARRVTELNALRSASFRQAIADCGFLFMKRITPELKS